MSQTEAKFRGKAKMPYRRSFEITDVIEPIEERIVGREVGISSDFDRLTAYHLGQQFVEPKVHISSPVYVQGDITKFSETACPWVTQSSTPKQSKTLKQAKVLKGFWVNSIFRNTNWNGNYFHWHRNFLTGLSFLIDQGFEDLRIVVEDKLHEFQTSSLEALGIKEADLFRFSTVRGTHLENLVSWSGIDRNQTATASDFVHPKFLASLSRKILNSFDLEGMPRQNLDLFATRGPVQNRRILNEAELRAFLTTEKNFLAIDGSKLTYREQVKLFSQARYVVGMHGGALTNVMFSKNVSLLELNANGHGLRPDFFPFAWALGGHMNALSFESENDENDIQVELGEVENYLRETPLRTDLAYRFSRAAK